MDVLTAMDPLLKYFPDLDETQLRRFSMLPSLYEEWNSKINVISRKDMDMLPLHHVLHSLAIAKYTLFPDGSRILDVGTGGGFPGIPLAIMFPRCHFTLSDSIGKKIRVVEAVAEGTGLDNVRAVHARSEEIKEKFDYVVSRAVAPLLQLWEWAGNKITVNRSPACPNGLICLKGGELQEEKAGLLKKFHGLSINDVPVTTWYDEPFFATKHVIHAFRP